MSVRRSSSLTEIVSATAAVVASLAACAQGAYIFATLDEYKNRRTFDNVLDACQSAVVLSQEFSRHYGIALARVNAGMQADLIASIPDPAYQFGFNGMQSAMSRYDAQLVRIRIFSPAIGSAAEQLGSHMLSMFADMIGENSSASRDDDLRDLVLLERSLLDLCRQEAGLTR